jgi:FkbM family methyltransferase
MSEMNTKAKEVVRTVLRRAGFELIRTHDPRRPTMEGALERSAQRGCVVTTVIDVGASDGRWSALAAQAFPKAHLFLVEAQPVHEPALKTFCDADPNHRSFLLAAAGNVDGKTHFDAEDPFGGVATSEALGSADIVVPMVSLDNEVKRRGLQPPFLLKLDTHGFEVPILEGFSSSLKLASLLVIEAYNYPIAKDSLLFFELCTFLHKRGFRPVDLVDVDLRHPGDALWQMDLFFARAEDPVFTHTSYS